MLCDTKPPSPHYRCYYGYVDVCDTTTSDSFFDDYDDDDCKDKYKRKTRNLSEKKRRDQFNMLINELCGMVSINNRKMDKSTVLKSTIAFLKNYQEISVQSQAHEIKENWKPSFLSNDEFTQLMLEALDSFLLVFTQQGNIMYASESVTSLLGHLAIDLTNKSIYDFVHENERLNMYNLITTQSALSGEGTPDFEKDDNQLTFTVHMKRGLLVPTDPQIYEFVKVSGNFRRWSGDPGASPRDSDNESVSKTSEIFSPKPTDTVCFCCTVHLNTSQLIREMSVIDESKTVFTSRHSMEWKFLFLDHRAPPIIGYLPFELLGTSGYDYYHPDDLEKISACHEHLMQTGEGNSCYYRFLTKGQQWIWLKTRYFISYHQWNCKPEFVVCTHTLASYADVRAQVRKELGFSEEDLEAGYDSVQSEFCQSDICSVTSGDQLVSGWSSSHSLRSVTPDRTGRKHGGSDMEGSDTQQTPHSTAQLSPRAMPQSDPLVVAQAKQGPPSSRLTPPSPPLAGSSRTQPAHSVRLSPLVNPSSAPATPSPPSPLVPGPVFMTVAQRHLRDQLQRKSQQLQDAIRQQQEELRQITDQLCLAPAPTMPPNILSQHSGPVVQSPQHSLQNFSPIRALRPMLSPDTSHPSASSTPISLHHQQQTMSPHQEQQFVPFQLLQQPPQQLFAQPHNLPSSSSQSHPPPE